MDVFHKIIVQRMEQQIQQLKELQQQRNEERLLQSLMKSEEQQKQMDELQLKSFNGTKSSVNDITIYISIETFEYVTVKNFNKTLKQRVEELVYIIEDLKNIHKRHLNQLRKC